MDFYQAIRLRALATILHPDREYLIRRTIRWYSKTFHTPIAAVEEMPLEDVVSAYYEEQYAQMTDEQREAEREDLLTSDETRVARIIAEEAEEAELYELAQVVAAEEAEKKKKKDGNLSDVKTHSRPLLKPELPESDLPRSKPSDTLPEGITMTFVDESELDKDLEGFGTMSQPEPKL